MAWPLMSDYQDSIQNPRFCFSDSELREGTPVLNGLGLPHPITGGFASVYQIVNGRRWAVRCFLHEFLDQQKRYHDIDRHLRSADFPYKVGFEFQPSGIRIQGKWHPILKMEWVEGVPLNVYIESILGDRQALLKLADAWRAFLRCLKSAGIAHGDLQHGNVLVSGRTLDIPVAFDTGTSMSGGGQIRMIDYDGMYVPALSGMGTHEAGHPCYQHPKRAADDYGPDLDRFSGLAIYVAILALSREPALWGQFNNGDNILFCKDDFLNPPRSRVFSAIRRINDPEVSGRVMALQAACVGPVKFVPGIDDATAIPRLPVWVMNQMMAPPEILASNVFTGSRAFVFAFEQAWSRPGERREKHVRYEPVYQTRTRQVKKTVSDERTMPAWLLYLVVQMAALAINRSLLIFSLTLGSLIFHLVKGTRVIEVTESYQTQTGTRPIEEWETIHESGHDRAVTSVAFTNDGQTLLSAGDDKFSMAWKPDSGERLFDIARLDEKICGIVSVNGAYFATASRGKTFRLWSRSDRSYKEFQLNLKTRFYSIAADPAGHYIAFGLGQRKILIWDVESHKDVACLEGHRRKVLSVAFFPDGNRLTSASADMSVRVWNLRSGACEGILNGHTNDVRVVCVSPDGKWIASGGDDGVIFVWDAKTHRPALKITAGSRIHALTFDPDGTCLLSGGADRLVRCWDCKTGREIGALDGHDGSVRGLSISPDGTEIASCGDDGRVILWRRAKQKQGVI